MTEENKVVIFENKAIRKIWYNDEWYFSIVDIIEVLTDSPIPRNYWSLLKKREPQLHTICMQLKMPAQDGKMRITDCANTEGVFRVIMSVPSPKAEPFKLWLAEQGKRTLDEINDPELLTERQVEIYRLKGYDEDWIAKRLQSIKTRKELTDEWQKRGVSDNKEYSVLTATIAKGTFGITPSEHSQLKGLEKDNLRDHMTPMELILTALSEEATRQIAIRDNAQGFYENHESAVLGSKIGGDARQNFEKTTGLTVVSNQNYLNQIQEAEKNSLPSNDIENIAPEE